MFSCPSTVQMYSCLPAASLSPSLTLVRLAAWTAPERTISPTTATVIAVKTVRSPRRTRRGLRRSILDEGDCAPHQGDDKRYDNRHRKAEVKEAVDVTQGWDYRRRMNQQV